MARLGINTETRSMIPRIHLFGAWSLVVFLTTYLLGLWVLSDFVPAHPPTATAQEISQIYAADANWIRSGMLLVMVAAAFYLPWTVTVSALIRRMEDESTFLSQCQLIGGLASSFFFVLPALIWQVAAYRPERNADIIYMLNDAGWIFTVTPVPPFLVQFIPLSLAILWNKNPAIVFPRWLGFASLWACVLFSPAVIAYFVLAGPFAWNGLFSFWIPLTVFVIWELGLVYYAFKCIEK